LGALGADADSNQTSIGNILLIVKNASYFAFLVALPMSSTPVAYSLYILAFFASTI